MLAFLAASWQAWVARDTEKRELRAYVFISGGSIDDVRSNNSPAIRLELKNSGQTPAYNLCSGLGARLAPYPLNERMRAPNYQSRGVLPPGVQESMIVDSPRPLTDTERNSLLTGKSALYAYGTTRFKDAFGTYWCVDYRYFYHIDGPHDTRWGVIAPCPTGNGERRCDKAEEPHCAATAQ